MKIKETEEKIRHYIEEKYDSSWLKGTNFDETIWLDMRTGDIFSTFQVSSNWSFASAEARNYIELYKFPALTDYNWTEGLADECIRRKGEKFVLVPSAWKEYYEIQLADTEFDSIEEAYQYIEENYPQIVEEIMQEDWEKEREEIIKHAMIILEKGGAR